MSPQLQAVPHVAVELDGSSLSIEDKRTLWSIRVQQRLSLPTVCELAFLDPTNSLTDGSVFSTGSSLKVTVSGADDSLFSGEVTAVEHVYEPSHGRQLRVRAYDRLHRLRKRQPVRAHVEQTTLDLIREIVSDMQVDVQASVTGPSRQRVIQYCQSDFELMSELTERAGLYFFLSEDELRVFTLEGTGDTVDLRLGTSLLEARVEVNGDSSCRSVSTTGWDPLRVEQHEAKASGARSGRDVEAQVDPSAIGGSDERMIIDEVLADDLQAEAIAQAELDLRAAREVVLRGVAEGNPKLQPGTPVNIENIAGSIAGKYILTSVDHTFDSVQGFVSAISSEPPVSRRRQRVPIAALGIVTHVNDPEGYGRIRVRLPTYKDIETDWMGVVTPGAGLGKGLLALPDVEDTVLVLLPGGDPANGVVLGGLYGMMTRDEWDWGVEESAVKRYTLRTPGGQRVRLDDAKKVIRLENSDGSFIEMSPKKVTLHSRRDLQIEAPGHNLVVKANKIDFQQG